MLGNAQSCMFSKMLSLFLLYKIVLRIFLKLIVWTHVDMKFEQMLRFRSLTHFFLSCVLFEIFALFHWGVIMPRHKKWQGIMLYPPNFGVSVRPSVCPSVRLSVRPSVRPSRLIIRVRSITLIPLEIISRNLAQYKA